MTFHDDRGHNPCELCPNQIVPPVKAITWEGEAYRTPLSGAAQFSKQNLICSQFNVQGRFVKTPSVSPMFVILVRILMFAGL